MKRARIIAAGAFAMLLAMTAIALTPIASRAQDEGGSAMGRGSDSALKNPSLPGDSSIAADPAMAPPMERMHIRQPVTGSMMAAPPYGVAPMNVGFFVLADDPEGIGFLTYSWNFGDGTVSALPPELYIFHTYKMPGTYVCSLTIKTVDGRSQIFRQGVVVKARN